MPRESFDVYYYQNGRWSLHASYEADQREQAIGDAMGVESKLNLPARVVRETFLDDSTNSEATVTWQGTKGRKISDNDDMFGAKLAPSKSPPARKPVPIAPPPPAAKSKTPAKPAPKPKSKKKKGRSMFTDLAIAISISTVIAVMSAAGVALLTLQLQKTGTIAVFDSTPVIFGSFILIFFIALLVQLNKMFKLFATLRSKEAAASDSVAVASPASGPRKGRRKAAVLDNEFDGVVVERGQTEETPADTAQADAPADDLPPSLDADVPTQVGTTEAPEPAEAPAPAAASPPPAAESTAASTPVAPPPPPPPPPARAATKADDEARQVFASFISDAAAAVQRDVGQLNAVTKMGFNLYLSGGLSTLGTSKRLSRESQITVLKQGLQAAGNSAERAAAFAVELPSYGKNPRYAGMIQAGAQAMQGHLAGKPQAAVSIAPMLSEWSRPEKRPATPTTFTFMFTDMVGSTAITQERGNSEAQKIVRAHNNAVRSAIAQNRGREVKHTGDGIMAVFQDAPGAVMAGIQMQREFAEHNENFPNLPLTVRIGLNSGEAVQEENDFFGAAVQMAARVCAQAASGHIWASQTVVDACKGRKLGFIPRGRFQMKGIQGARVLYEVGWTDAHRNELADL